jgi:serine/threonine-protein kinase ULK/ATG1
VADIEKMKDINQYAHDVITKQKNEEFTGRYVNRKFEREDIQEEEENIHPNHNQIEEEQYDTQLKHFMKSTETNREKKIRIFKLNSSKILHERNKYVFLASVAERAISLGEKLSDVLGFVLIKKLFKMLCYLRYMLQQKVKDNS